MGAKPLPSPKENPDSFGPAGESLRSTADDYQEHASQEAQALCALPAKPQELFSQFRRKLAAGETVSRATEKLAEALRFSGRITLTFHQGKITKTILEEAYFRGRRSS